MNQPKPKRGRPASTPQNRENQLIDLAMGLVEERIRQGKASDSLLVQICRMGSSRERLEKEHLRVRTELDKAKTHSIEASDRMESMYQEAMQAMRTYSGLLEESEDEQKLC